MSREYDECGYVWRASATYADGTETDGLYMPNPQLTEEDDQFRLEEWLISRHDGCTWYSVSPHYI